MNFLSTIPHHAANCDNIFIRKSFTQWIAESCILISLIYTTWGIKYFWLIGFRKKNVLSKFDPTHSQLWPHCDQVYPGIMFWTNLNLHYLWKSRHKLQVFCRVGFSEENMLSYQHIPILQILIFLKGTWPLIRTILKPLALLMHYTNFGLNKPSGSKKRWNCEIFTRTMTTAIDSGRILTEKSTKTFSLSDLKCEK